MTQQHYPGVNKHLRILSMRTYLIAAAVAIFLVLFAVLPSYAGETLAGVKARKVLRCGVSEGITGFSTRNEAGRWVGLEADFCRAVAAAVLGDGEKVKFVPLKASERFPALLAGTIDLLACVSTCTLGREAGLKLMFPGTIFYDGQAFMVTASSRIREIRQLDGAAICVEKGTTEERYLADYFATHGMSYRPVVIDSSLGVADAFFAGRCRAYTSISSQLAAARLRVPAGARKYVILPYRISREPISPVVRRGDNDWYTLVRWVLFALIAAEDAGITRDNVGTLRTTSANPALRRALGVGGGYGREMGVDDEWALRAVRTVGNYGEMFERNLGPRSALDLDRDLNRLWNRGGLLYAPPLR